MLYGEEKQRQMARSILPSKKRKAARFAAASLKRKARRVTRQRLHVWSAYDDPHDYEGHLVDHWDAKTCADPWTYAGGIQGVVEERREADKLAPVMRWARAITAHLDDPEDRLNHMKRILPDNLIGRHALGHLEALEEFDVIYDHERWYRREPLATIDGLDEAIATILHFGGLFELNRRLNAAHVTEHSRPRFRSTGFDKYTCIGCCFRPLADAEGAEAFADALIAAQRHHPEDVTMVLDMAQALR